MLLTCSISIKGDQVWGKSCWGCFLDITYLTDIGHNEHTHNWIKLVSLTHCIESPQHRELSISSLRAYKREFTNCGLVFNDLGKGKGKNCSELYAVHQSEHENSGEMNNTNISDLSVKKLLI